MAFTNIELSILGEIGNVSVGGAATSLSDFVNKLVTISIPKTQVSTIKELENKFQSPFYIKIDYTGELEGSNVLMIEKSEGLNFAKTIAKEKLGMELKEWDSLTENILMEMFNVMVGHMSNSMEIIFNKEIRIQPPEINHDELDRLIDTDKNEEVVFVMFDIKTEGEFQIQLLNVIKKDQATKMVQLIAGDYNI